MDDQSPLQQALRRFARNRSALWSAVFLAIGMSLVIGWPLLRIPAVSSLLPDALVQSADTLSDAQFHPPTWTHWFGTDVHGRDLLSRVMYGARVSILVGVVGAGVSLLIGVSWGAAAGYLGGRWDNRMMRCVDILYSLPSIVFVIVLITTLEDLFRGWLSRLISPEAGDLTRLLFLFAGLGAVSWLTMARIVRGQVLALRNRPFVDASRALGAGPVRILATHILPNLAGVIIVYTTLSIPSIILYESFLSYLGLGIQPPQASLGSLLSDGAAQINPVRVYWWVVLAPGGILTATLMALNFVGDGLRDAFEPDDA